MAALALGVAPGVAFAEETASVRALEVARGSFGPNSGTLSAGASQFGATPIFAIHLSDPTTKITALRLVVIGSGIRVPIDFDRVDGFELYQDLGTPGFDRSDYFQGAVNGGYAVGTTDSEGRTPVTLKIYEALPLPSADYVVTVRPSAAPLADRTVQFSIPAAGIGTSRGSLPADAVSTASLRIDSVAPQTPTATNFEVVQNTPGTSDLVMVRDEAREAALRIGFFNHSVGVSMANLLVQPDTTPALASAGAGTLAIGDGSGITAVSSVAGNNQTSDKLWARAVDAADNVSDPVQLTNDVTAPGVTGPSITVEGTSITLVNRQAVVIKAVTSGVFDAVRAEGWIRAIDKTTGMEAARSGSVSGTYAPTMLFPAIDTEPLGGDELEFRAEVRILDAAGNATNVLSSAAITKDTLAPMVLGVSRVTQRMSSCPGSGAQGLTTNCTVAGDTFHVAFSETMKVGSISSANLNTTLQLVGASDSDAPSWGTSPQWKWDDEITRLGGTVTVDAAPSGRRLVLTGDRVRPTNVPDDAGNATPDTALVEGVGVALTSAKTNDLVGSPRWGLSRDGKLDTVDVTFAGIIDSESARRATTDFRVINGTALAPVSSRLVSADPTTKTSVVQLQFASDWSTADRPIVAYGVNGGRTMFGTPPSPGATAAPVAAGAVVSTDGAAPLPVSVSTADDNVNGRIDTLVVRYSEPVDHSTETPKGYAVTGYENNSDTFPAAKWNSFTPTAGVSNTTRVALAEATSSFDTAATPGAKFGGSVTDAAKNALTSWITTATDPTTDAAPPLLLTRATLDINEDGYLDVVATTASEPLATSSVARGQFVVDDRPIEGIVPISSAEQWILIGPRQFATGPDTDDTPLVQYLGGRDGGITDASPGRVRLPIDGASVVAMDSAGPAITAAVPLRGSLSDETHRVQLQMSERVDAGTLEVDDFFIRQASDAMFPVEVRLLADSRTVELRLPNTFRPGETAAVELSQPGAVLDSASPQNISGIGAPVPLAAVPSAALTVTGPATSRPGYSISRTVSVTATGNELVTGWLLLADQSAEPAVTDPRFVTSPPQTFTFSSDGVHRLTLWTRDDQGRLSTPATVSIDVDRTPPTLVSPKVEYVNPDAAWGIRADDQARVVTRASGSDAAQWSAADARVSYAGLAAASGMDSVAPLVFSLTTPPGRLIEFPFVKTTAVARILPAGTIVRPAGASSPTYFLGQTSTGKQYLRPMSPGVRSSYAVRNADVVPVPANELAALSTLSPLRVREGSLIRSSTGATTVYAVVGGVRRAVSAAAFKALRYSSSAVIVLPAAEVSAIRLGSALGTWRHAPGTYVRAADGKVYRISIGANGAWVRRRVTSSVALSTLARSVDVVPALTRDLSLPLDTLVLGLRDGVVSRDKTTGRYFVVSHGLRRLFSANAMAARMGYAVSSAVASSTADLTVRTGTTRVDGPAIASRNVAIHLSVGDQAGNITRTVLPVPVLGRPESFGVAGFVAA